MVSIDTLVSVETRAHHGDAPRSHSRNDRRVEPVPKSDGSTTAECRTLGDGQAVYSYRSSTVTSARGARCRASSSPSVVESSPKQRRERSPKSEQRRGQEAVESSAYSINHLPMPRCSRSSITAHRAIRADRYQSMMYALRWLAHARGVVPSLATKGPLWRTRSTKSSLRRVDRTGWPA